MRYGPYNAASREFFDALAAALTATGGGAAIERGSIDEAFVELAMMPRDPAAFCGRLRAAVEGATGLRVTVGCGPNKLLAKLASSAAKGTDAAVRVVDGGAAVEDLLAASPASRLPGLSKPPAGAKTISDLRAYELDDGSMRVSFGSSAIPGELPVSFRIEKTPDGQAPRIEQWEGRNALAVPEHVRRGPIPRQATE